MESSSMKRKISHELQSNECYEQILQVKRPKIAEKAAKSSSRSHHTDNIKVNISARVKSSVVIKTNEYSVKSRSDDQVKISYKSQHKSSHSDYSSKSKGSNDSLVKSELRVIGKSSKYVKLVSSQTEKMNINSVSTKHMDKAEKKRSRSSKEIKLLKDIFGEDYTDDEDELAKLVPAKSSNKNELKTTSSNTGKPSKTLALMKEFFGEKELVKSTPSTVESSVCKEKPNIQIVEKSPTKSVSQKQLTTTKKQVRSSKEVELMKDIFGDNYTDDEDELAKSAPTLKSQQAKPLKENPVSPPKLKKTAKKQERPLKTIAFMTELFGENYTDDEEELAKAKTSTEKSTESKESKKSKTACKERCYKDALAMEKKRKQIDDEFESKLVKDFQITPGKWMAKRQPTNIEKFRKNSQDFVLDDLNVSFSDHDESQIVNPPSPKLHELWF